MRVVALVLALACTALGQAWTTPRGTSVGLTGLYGGMAVNVALPVGATGVSIKHYWVHPAQEAPMTAFRYDPVTGLLKISCPREKGRPKPSGAQGWDMLVVKYTHGGVTRETHRFYTNFL